MKELCGKLSFALTHQIKAAFGREGAASVIPCSASGPDGIPWSSWAHPLPIPTLSCTLLVELEHHLPGRDIQPCFKIPKSLRICCLPPR